MRAHGRRLVREFPVAQGPRCGSWNEPQLSPARSFSPSSCGVAPAGLGVAPAARFPQRPLIQSRLLRAVGGPWRLAFCPLDCGRGEAHRSLVRQRAGTFSNGGRVVKRVVSRK